MRYNAANKLYTALVRNCMNINMRFCFFSRIPRRKPMKKIIIMLKSTIISLRTERHTIFVKKQMLRTKWDTVDKFEYEKRVQLDKYKNY